MVVSIVFPGTKAITLGELTTISYSVYRDKVPVRTCSYINVRGFTKGPRTVAGTMIFTVFDKHVVNRLRAEVPYFASLVKMKADEWPPFDIYITMGNEYGASARLNIYGLTIVDEGQVMSVEDLFTENQWSFMARNIDLQDEIGAEQNVPSTTMDHVEAVPTFTADSLVMDDDFVAMKEELKKMQDAAKAAVDAARAKAKEAYTTSAQEFAMAEVPTDKFDGWVNSPSVYDIPEGQDPDYNDYSYITDIRAELLNDMPLINWNIFDGDNRVVYVEVYAKGTDITSHKWSLPDNISVGLGLTDQNGTDLKTQDDGGGDKAPLKQWASSPLGSSKSDRITWSGKKCVKFTIVDYKKCPIPPKIFVKLSITSDTVVIADDGADTEFRLSGSNVRNVENNDATGGANSDDMKFVLYTGEDVAKQSSINDANLALELHTTSPKESTEGSTVTIPMYYTQSWLTGFDLVTDAAAMLPFDEVCPSMFFDMSFDDGAMTSSDLDNLYIEGPINLYFNTNQGAYRVGGGGGNANFTGSAYASSSLTSWQNRKFRQAISDMLESPSTPHYIPDAIEFIFDTNIVLDSLLEDAYEAIKQVSDSYGATFDASDMYLVVGPFKVVDDSDANITCDFYGRDYLKIVFKEVAWYEGL